MKDLLKEVVAYSLRKSFLVFDTYLIAGVWIACLPVAPCIHGVKSAVVLQAPRQV